MTGSSATIPIDGSGESSTVVAGERIRGQLRHSMVLLMGRVLALGLNLSVQVLTVRYLAKEDYGALAFALSMVSFGANLSTLGLDKTLARFVAIHDERGEHGRLAGVLRFCIVGVCTSGLLIMLGTTGYLRLTAGDERLSISLLLLAITLVPMQALDNTLLSLSAAMHATWAIFMRRHVLTPSLKLAAVIGTIASAGSVKMLVLCHVAAGAVGVILFVGLLRRYFRRNGLTARLRGVPRTIESRRLLAYAGPMYFSDIVALLRAPMIVIFLEIYHGSLAVAEFRAVLPFARLNDIVLQSFAFLFIPMMARLFARGDTRGIQELHWRSVLWVTVFAFPIFSLTFALGGPLTVLVFGQRYANSGIVLSVLAVGYFVQTLTGLHSRALKVHGKVRHIVLADITATLVAVIANLSVVPRFGALGGAVCLTATLIVHSFVNQIMLERATGIPVLRWRYFGLYFSAAGLAVAVWQIHARLSPSLGVSLAVAVLASMLMLRIHRRALQVQETLPELMKLPFIGWLLRVPADEESERR